MQMKHKPLPASITKTESEEYDIYQGLTSELIEYGIVRADQLPGLPGHGKTAVTFWRGRAMARGERAQRDETFLSVYGIGPYISVRVGLSAAVLSARASAKRAKQEQKNKGKPMEYGDCQWGEIVTGSKEEIQAMGIGTGLVFPGEADGPQRELTTLDPRGIKTKVFISWDGRYTAHIYFPDRGRALLKDERKPFAHGVLKEEGTYSDNYYGTAEALVAAGLAKLHQLPGQPECTRKVSSTVFPDGSMPKGPCTATYLQGRLPGAKNIKRVSKSSYEISVVLPDEVKEKRGSASKQKEAEFDKKMEALPRPARLPIPASLRVQAPDVEGLDLERARRKLQDMPASKDEFRRDIVRSARQWFGVWFDTADMVKATHGYGLEEDAIQGIKIAFDAVAEAVMHAGVTFDRNKHDSTVRGLKTLIARQDQSFQAQLFSLTQPAPGVLEGEAS